MPPFIWKGMAPFIWKATNEGFPRTLWIRPHRGVSSGDSKADGPYPEGGNYPVTSPSLASPVSSQMLLAKFSSYGSSWWCRGGGKREHFVPLAPTPPHAVCSDREMACKSMRYPVSPANCAPCENPLHHGTIPTDHKRKMGVLKLVTAMYRRHSEAFGRHSAEGSHPQTSVDTRQS